MLIFLLLFFLGALSCSKELKAGELYSERDVAYKFFDFLPSSWENSVLISIDGPNKTVYASQTQQTPTEASHTWSASDGKLHIPSGGLNATGERLYFSVRSLDVEPFSVDIESPVKPPGYEVELSARTRSGKYQACFVRNFASLSECQAYVRKSESDCKRITCSSSGTLTMCTKYGDVSCTAQHMPYEAGASVSFQELSAGSTLLVAQGSVRDRGWVEMRYKDMAACQRARAHISKTSDSGTCAWISGSCTPSNPSLKYGLLGLTPLCKLEHVWSTEDVFDKMTYANF